MTPIVRLLAASLGGCKAELKPKEVRLTTMTLDMNLLFRLPLIHDNFTIKDYQPVWKQCGATMYARSGSLSEEINVSNAVDVKCWQQLRVNFPSTLHSYKESQQSSAQPLPPSRSYQHVYISAKL